MTPRRPSVIGRRSPGDTVQPRLEAVPLELLVAPVRDDEGVLHHIVHLPIGDAMAAHGMPHEAIVLTVQLTKRSQVSIDRNGSRHVRSP